MTPTCQCHMGTAHGQVFLISSIVWSHRFRPSPSWLVVTAVGRNCYSPVIMRTDVQLDLSSNVFWGIHMRAIRQELTMNLIHNMCFESTFLTFLPHLQGANEVNQLLQELLECYQIHAAAYEYCNCLPSAQCKCRMQITCDYNAISSVDY